jgi:DNA-binding transcriptional regulator YiaG
MEHDGREYTVTVPQLEILECEACHARVLPDKAHERLLDGLRRGAGLLTPGQIREARQALELHQKDLALALRVAPETVSRWETGAQIQQRAMDCLLRLFFALEEVREFLADESRMRVLGAAVIAEEDDAMAAGASHSSDTTLGSALAWRDVPMGGSSSHGFVLTGRSVGG